MLDILTRAGCYIAIIVLGNVLRRKGFFKEETFGVLSKIVISITLPASIIASSAGRPIDVSMLLLPVLGFGAGVLYILVSLTVNRRAGGGRKAFGIVNTAGYNIGTFAMPFAAGFLGPVGVQATSVFDVGNAFVVFGASFGVARAAKEGEKMDILRILKAPFRSIPFLTYLAMLILNLNSWNLPKPIVELAGIIGNANAFLAMLMIGVGFKLSGDRSQLGRIVKILSVRFGLAAVLAVCFWNFLPFDPVVRKTLVILAFSPMSSVSPVWTSELKEDVGLSSAITSVSIVISILIMVALLLILH